MLHTDTHLVLRPDTEFFRFFVDPSGKTPPGTTGAPAVTSAPGVPQRSSSVAQ
jgi:hypothetical protein